MDHNPSGSSAAELDSKTPSSADESDRSDQAASDMGTGRSYECVFCKRGFTTAQALGGHMNIHRKDRVKTKPAASNSAAFARPNPATNIHHQPPYPAALTMAPAELRVGPAWCLAPTASHDKGDELHHVHNNSPQLLNTPKENWTTMSLSTRLAGASHSTDHHHVQDQGNNGEEDELDLELRLGHDR